MLSTKMIIGISINKIVLLHKPQLFDPGGGEGDKGNPRPISE